MKQTKQHFFHFKIHRITSHLSHIWMEISPFSCLSKLNWVYL
ncbi:hypothetical protein [uncultured Gammaproteobacteria bacterium]|nr:hypothetical protein [uncultured Gammaproteobacteria bacterium]